MAASKCAILRRGTREPATNARFLSWRSVNPTVVCDVDGHTNPLEPRWTWSGKEQDSGSIRKRRKGEPGDVRIGRAPSSAGRGRRRPHRCGGNGTYGFDAAGLGTTTAEDPRPPQPHPGWETVPGSSSATSGKTVRREPGSVQGIARPWYVCRRGPSGPPRGSPSSRCCPREMDVDPKDPLKKRISEREPKPFHHERRPLSMAGADVVPWPAPFNGRLHIGGNAQGLTSRV